MADMNDCVIELEDIRKVYRMGEVDVNALDGLSLRVQRGEVMSIMGPSGSGKSTLMNIIGCLDRPTSGTYQLDGKTVSQLADDALAEIRNRKVGFRLPEFQSAGAFHGDGERGTAAALSRASATAGASARREVLAAGRFGRPDGAPADGAFRTGSSNGWPSPARWSTTRRSSWRTNRPGTWTAGRARRFWISCST